MHVCEEERKQNQETIKGVKYKAVISSLSLPWVVLKYWMSFPNNMEHVRFWDYCSFWFYIDSNLVPHCAQPVPTAVLLRPSSPSPATLRVLACNVFVPAELEKRQNGSVPHAPFCSSALQWAWVLIPAHCKEAGSELYFCFIMSIAGFVLQWDLVHLGRLHGEKRGTRTTMCYSSIIEWGLLRDIF